MERTYVTVGAIIHPNLIITAAPPTLRPISSFAIAPLRELQSFGHF
jgi:hypothetical protein